MRSPTLSTPWEKVVFDGAILSVSKKDGLGFGVDVEGAQKIAQTARSIDPNHAHAAAISMALNNPGYEIVLGA